MDKLRVGIVGCGGFSRGHAKNIVAMSEAELVALCDISDEALDRYIEAVYGPDGSDVTRFNDMKDMYASMNLDAVFITSPHTLHFEHCMLALENDCHVLVEKPMVTSTEDAIALKKKVEEKSKILTIGYNTPCTPMFKYIRDVIRNQTFGKLELINCFLSQNWYKPTTGSWRQKPELSGGGQAYDSGAHLLNSLIWSVESAPKQVSSFLENFDSKVDINSVINVRFENGVLASIAIGGNCDTKIGSHMALMFENGRIEVDGWIGQWMKVYGPDKEEIDPKLTGKAHTTTSDFINAVLGKSEPSTSPINGLNQSMLMDAIYKSAETGTIVNL